MFKKTVDSVVFAFQKTIADLEAIAARELDEVEVIEAKIAHLEDLGDEHQIEADRATALANNFKNLLEV